jgi:hypothetical protein
MALVNALAELKPKGGERGEVITGDLEKGKIESLLKVNTFRKGLPLAVSSQDVWPLFLVVMGCLFFADVFVRRVSVGFGWVGVIWNWLRAKLLRQQESAQPEQRLERLRTRKAAIAEQIDDRRAATRFEPVMDKLPESTDASEILEQASGGASTAAPLPSRPTATLSPTQPEAESYTSRLLKAKQQARKETDK